MPIPIWAGRYIGLPFKSHGRDRAGLDCWGLVRLALHEQFGLALPAYSYHYRAADDPLSASAHVLATAAHWRKIEQTGAQAGDVIVLRLRGQPMHVGLVLDDQHMLHIEEGIDSAIERYTAPRWQSRIHGFYRYPEL